MKTIYERAKAAQLETDNYESDLYLKDTPEARRIVREWQEESGRDGAITYFHDTEGAQWIDVPLAFDPFWQAKNQRSSIMDAQPRRRRGL